MLLVVSAWTACIAFAGNDVRSISLEESAWAAKVSAEELGVRVAAGVMNRVELHAEQYAADLQLQALLAFGDAVNERRYLEFVQAVMKRREMPPTYVHPWQSQYFTSLAFDLYIRTRDKDYVEPFLRESHLYRADVPRTYDGIISHYYDHQNGKPMWTLRSKAAYLDEKWRPILIDQVQEYASRMAKAGCLSEEDSFYTEAAQQIELLRSALRDPATGLWAHGRGWFASDTTVANTKWGRAHAWLLRGLVEMLTFLPADSPESRRVSAILRELGETLTKYQDNKGFWHQVVDRQDSFQETSATGLISYYLARAVRQRLLPEQPYRSVSARAFEAITQSKVSAAGIVYGATPSTGPMPTDRHYLEYPTPANDGRGVAAVIYGAAGRLLLDGRGVVSSGGSERTVCRHQ